MDKKGETGEKLGERWTVKKQIGSGGFGLVFRAFDEQLNKDVAVKMEPLKQKETLAIEARVFADLKSSPHCPAFYGFGITATHNFIAMELLSRNIADIRRDNHFCRFSLRTTCALGLQMLEALRQLHIVGWIHRDVKPSNFALGLTEPNTHQTTDRVFLIDFGLCRQFMDEGVHKAARERHGKFRGTHRYASLAAHDGRDLGRVDDLWSLFYSLVELHNGSVPWHRLRDPKEVRNWKKRLSVEALCKGLPDDVSSFGRLLEGYSFDSEPDYAALAAHLDAVRAKAGGPGPWDWEDAYQTLKMEDKLADAKAKVKVRRGKRMMKTVDGLGTKAHGGITGASDMEIRAPTDVNHHRPPLTAAANRKPDAASPPA